MESLEVIIEILRIIVQEDKIPLQDFYKKIFPKKVIARENDVIMSENDVIMSENFDYWTVILEIDCRFVDYYIIKRLFETIIETKSNYHMFILGERHSKFLSNCLHYTNIKIKDKMKDVEHQVYGSEYASNITSYVDMTNIYYPNINKSVEEG